MAVDLARADEIQLAVEQTMAQFGRIDVLVNAAATDVPGLLSISPWRAQYVLNDCATTAVFTLST